MATIFISYARPDEREAEQVAEALRRAGYEVWRDDQLPVHRAYSEVIEERLLAAKAVVVLWSAAAVKSQWVRSEADAARSAGTLVQLTVDGTAPPMPFNQIQCADLAGRPGNSGNPGWRKLLASVEALAGAARHATDQPKRRKQRSICVLPFANMSGDPEQEYFSDGISEDITTDLSKVSSLAVTARNTAFTFRGAAVDVCEVARKLGVSHVLEGSVRKAGNRLRITAQLVDGATGDHLWAERYDRDLTDIFAIQDEISTAIVEALKVKLQPEEKKAIEQRGTGNADAYNLYLLARKYWISGNYGDPRREEIVIRIAKRAIEMDADYAQAWALLAIAQSSLRYHHGRDGEDGSDAAERALQLDAGMAEAYCVRARHLFEQDDFAGADAEIRRGLELDPSSWEVNREAARLCMTQRRIDEAIGFFEKAASLAEGDYHSWSILLTCYADRGQREKVRHAAEMMVVRTDKVIAEDPANAAALGINAGGLAVLGDVERAKERIGRAMLIDPDNLNMPYNFACILTRWLGDHDAALDLLEQNFARISRGLVITAMADPDLDALRGMPRFERMLANAIERTGVTAPALNPAAGEAQPRS